MDINKNISFSLSYQVDLLFTAIAGAQSEFPAVRKTDQGHRHKYANIISVIEATRPILAKHGLSIIQPPSRDVDASPILITVLSHISGQHCISSMGIIHDPSDIQSLGSGITYTRRYAMLSILGLEQEDDDGNYAKKKVIDKKEAGEKVLVNQSQLNKLKEKINSSKDPVAMLEKVAHKTHLNLGELWRMTDKQFEWVMKNIDIDLANK